MRFHLYIIIWVVALVQVLAQASPQTDTTLRISVQQSIEIALASNEQLKITRLEQDISEAEVRKTIAQGLPQANINSGLNYNFVPQRSLVDVSAFDPTAPAGTESFISFAQNYDANFALSVEQLIFDGSYFVGLQAARTYRELATKEHKRNEIDIVESVHKAYYTALINTEQLELVDKNYQRLDTLLRQTQALNENGFAEGIDVDRVRVSYNNVAVEKARLEKLTEISYKLLKFQMGVSLETPLELSDSLSALTPERQSFLSDEFSYDDRIEYSQVITNSNLARLDLKNNRVQYMPKLYAQLNYGANTAAPDFNEIFESNRWVSFGTVGLSLSIPVFDGFLKSNRIQQNKIQLMQLENQQRYLEKSIDLEIQQSMINLNSNVETMEVQKQNWELAENIYNITQIKYTEGVGSNLEVIDADTDLKEAQINYYNALFDAMIAEIELKKALGTLHQ